MDYIIKVEQRDPDDPTKWEPVVGAEVRIEGVGVDDTDRAGVATIPIPVAKVITRGTSYATRTGRAAGEVADEPDLISLHVFHAPGGAHGDTVWATPGIELVVRA